MDNPLTGLSLLDVAPDVKIKDKTESCNGGNRVDNGWNCLDNVTVDDALAPPAVAFSGGHPIGLAMNPAGGFSPALGKLLGRDPLGDALVEHDQLGSSRGHNRLSAKSIIWKRAKS